MSAIKIVFRVLSMVACAPFVLAALLWVGGLAALGFATYCVLLAAMYFLVDVLLLPVSFAIFALEGKWLWAHSEEFQSRHPPPESY